MTKPGSRLLLGVLTFALSAAAGAQIRMADVTGGRVAGVVTDDIASFKGIPFAAPPVGPNRWRAPQAVEAWNGTLSADTFAPSCMQDMTISIPLGVPPGVSEDCLHLNVWTPARSTDEALPVMVWIYGGGFAIGSTSTPAYDGTNFAERGVVLVSAAYRVGPFGFLAHPELSREGGGSGNYGLLDMVAALRWVEDNIEQFGGDPDNVTIFGESAGAIAVSMLTVVPQAEGLFDRAISESGGSFAEPGSRGVSAEAAAVGADGPYTLAAAEAVGIDFFAQIGADDLASARQLDAADIQAVLPPGLVATFWPVADGQVIPDNQYRLYEAGRFHDTPVLIGTNSDEGAMFAPPGVTPESLMAGARASFGGAADTVLAAYPHATQAEAQEAMQDMFRDSVFAWNTRTWAKLQDRHGDNDAYIYYFDHRTPLSPNGANHAAEIGYVFGTIGGPGAGMFGPVQLSDADRQLSERMMGYWVNFATHGDPNGQGLPEWPAYDSEREMAMVFDDATGARPLPNRQQLDAMDAYFQMQRRAGR